MKYIGVDLSLNHTGLAIIDENEKILVTHEIDTDTKKSTWFRIIETIQGLSLFLEDCDNIAVEDVFMGINFKAAKDAIRLSGALMYHAFLRCKKEPILLMAVSARKLCGIKGNCSKAEVQLFVLKKFSLAEESKFKMHEVNLNSLNESYKKEKSKVLKNKIKRDIMKLSALIEKEFNLSEHVADSLVLALAIKRYTEAQQKIK
jgi:Holliday junction resolvasome RuvABC endonuclease subunit